MFVLVFYALSPVPTMVAKRYADSLESSSALIEFCYFITAGIVISAYGLPIVLAHAPKDSTVVRNNFISPNILNKTCYTDAILYHKLSLYIC